MDISHEDLQDFCSLKQAKDIRTIKNCVIFFTVVAILSLAVTILIAAGNAFWKSKRQSVWLCLFGYSKAEVRVLSSIDLVFGLDSMQRFEDGVREDKQKDNIGYGIDDHKRQTWCEVYQVARE